MDSISRGSSPRRGASPQDSYNSLLRKPLPYLQVAEAAIAIDANCTLERLTALLDAGDRTPDQHAADVAAVVEELIADRLLVRSDPELFATPDDAQLHRSEGLARVIERPMQLGPPLRDIYTDAHAETMRQILRRLEVKVPTRKADIVEAIVTRLGDPDFVRSVVKTAPATTQEILLTIARGEDATDSTLVRGGRAGFDYDRYRQEQAARSWAVEHGLMVGGYYSFTAVMPCEVAVALLGPDARVPFTPMEPPLLVRPLAPDLVAGYSAAAATEFADHALAILDRVARHPLTQLKAGGVGVRELSKIAKITMSEPATARMVLELAAAAGLLDSSQGLVKVSSIFAAWRDSDPSGRLVTLLRAWWRFSGSATRATADDGSALAVLAGNQGCAMCLAAKSAVAGVLADVAGGVTAAQVAARARWRAPFAHLGWEPTADDLDGTGGGGTAGGGAADEPFALLWGELTMLGLVADGAMSPLGHAVAVADWELAGELLAVAMPPAVDRALFGADLTAYVTGAPTSAVSALLDSAADREGRGGAVAWRFSPGSVRRALDAGSTADSLLAALCGIADGELPQPLTYLVNEIGQRHGSLLVSDAVSVIRSDDAALLVQVVADRKLKGLGLRSVAPTVVVSEVESDALLAALREAGYLPMPEPGVTPGGAGSSGRGAKAARASGPGSQQAGGRAARPAAPRRRRRR